MSKSSKAGFVVFRDRFEMKFQKQPHRRPAVAGRSPHVPLRTNSLPSGNLTGVQTIALARGVHLGQWRRAFPAIQPPRVWTITGNISESSIRMRSKMLRCGLPYRGRRSRVRKKDSTRGSQKTRGKEPFFARSARKIHHRDTEDTEMPRSLCALCVSVVILILRCA